MITFFKYVQPQTHNFFVVCLVVYDPERQALYAVLGVCNTLQFLLYAFLVQGRRHVWFYLPGHMKIITIFSSYETPGN